MTLIIRWIINAAALVAAAYALSKVGVEGMTVDLNQPVSLLVAAAVFGIVNTLLRPLLLSLSCLINAVTFGLFTLVVNAGLLWLTGLIVGTLKLPGFRVDTLLAAFLGAILVSVVSAVLGGFARGR